MKAIVVDDEQLARDELRLHSVAGHGTSVRLELPDMALPQRIPA